MSAIQQRVNQTASCVQVQLTRKQRDGSPLPLGEAYLVNGYLTGLSDSQQTWTHIHTLSKEAGRVHPLGNGSALYISRSVYNAFQGEHATLLGFTLSAVLGR